MGMRDLDEARKWNKIGVLVSGGADSAITLYKIAKSLPEKNIIPITYVEKYMTEGILATAPKVVEYCKSRFDNISSHIITHIDVHVKDKSHTIHIKNLELYEEGVIDFLITGRTANPPVEYMEENNMMTKRQPERDSDSNVWQNEHIHGKRLYKPFSGMDKKQIWKFYQEEGVEDLWDLTGSCVRTYPACGECWWCKEREYARG